MCVPLCMTTTSGQCVKTRIYSYGVWALESVKFIRERSPLAHVGAASRPFRSVERTCVRSALSIKTRSKNIELMTSNGRVTDTSSAETNLASHLTSCAWRLQQGVEASLCSSQSASRAANPLRQLCRIMVRYAPLVSLRPKPPLVLGRMRAASALSATTECLPAAAEML